MVVEEEEIVVEEEGVATVEEDVVVEKESKSGPKPQHKFRMRSRAGGSPHQISRSRSAEWSRRTPQFHWTLYHWPNRTVCRHRPAVRFPDSCCSSVSNLPQSDNGLWTACCCSEREDFNCANKFAIMKNTLSVMVYKIQRVCRERTKNIALIKLPTLDKIYRS